MIGCHGIGIGITVLIVYMCTMVSSHLIQISVFVQVFGCKWQHVHGFLGAYLVFS